MQIPVALIGVAEGLRLQVEVALSDADYRVEDPPDLDRWRLVGGRRGLVVAASVLEEMEVSDEHQADETVTLALVPEMGPDRCRAALRSGADAVAAEEPAIVVEALDHLVRGWAMLPAAVAREIISPDLPHELSPDELRWVRQLADGLSIEVIAEEAGYAERQMYRFLVKVQDKVGAENRAQLIAWAGRAGVYP